MTISTESNYSPSYFEIAKASVKKGVQSCTQLSYKLETYKFPQKLLKSAIRIGEVAAPILVIYLPLKTTKAGLKNYQLITNFFVGFRSIDAFLNGKADTWKLLALNIASFALFIFNNLDILEKFEFHLSFIHKTTKAVPFLGVLPYAGLLALSKFVLFSCILSNNQDKHKEKLLAWERAEEKLAEWQKPLDQQQLKVKIDNYSRKIAAETDTDKQAKLKAKQLVWRNMHGQFNELKHVIESTKLYKVQKWEKITLEKKKSELGIKALKVSLIGFVAITLLTVAGASSGILTGIGFALMVPDLYYGFKKEFLKHQIENMPAPPEELVSLQHFKFSIDKK